MLKEKNKIYDWKDRLRKGKMLTLVVSLISIIITLTVFSLSLSKKYRELSENSNNQAFYELVEYINNTEKLLAKSTISNDSKHGAIVLTSAWKSATLAQSYLSRIPVEVEKLENVNRFLNQVGDYCYSLSKKSINGEKLSQDELNQLSLLHQYCINLENTINQLEEDLYTGNIRWGALRNNGNKTIGDENESLEKSSFLSIEEDLHQYTGLIYDGAFSENQNKFKGYGLSGDDIGEEEAKKKSKEFLGEDKIKEIKSNGISENGRISCFSFSIKLVNDTETSICVSKKGGHIVSMNNNRNVIEHLIDEKEDVERGKKYLIEKGYSNMNENYYMKNNNILTINYAYSQSDITIYPDLIKLKVALDNGEIVGIETTNYLNSHSERTIENAKITKEAALEYINPNIEIKGTNLAIIPTEYGSEILCWEIKGRIITNVNENIVSNDFLVYINAETGKEEDILLIVDTPNGTLTM